MKKFQLFSWLGAVAIAFSVFTASCSGAKKVAGNAASDSLVPQEKALLWSIAGNGIKKPSYLYGTIHVIPKDDYFMPDYVERSFAKAEKVVFEINMEDMNDMSMMAGMAQMMFMPEGTSLKTLLSEEDYKMVKEELKDNIMVAMLGDMADRIKPFFLSAMLDSGGEGAEGADPMNPFGMGGGMMGGNTTSYEMEFTEMAKKAEKPMDGLETIEFQMSIFDAIPLEDQAQMLVEAIKSEADPENPEDIMRKMVDMYKDQDIQGLYEMIHVQSAGSKEFEDKLLISRNKNWIPLMAEMMKEQITFFAVGAGHLGGDEGVIALLRKEGYVVRPVLK